MGIASAWDDLASYTFLLHCVRSRQLHLPQHRMQLDIRRGALWRVCSFTLSAFFFVCRSGALLSTARLVQTFCQPSLSAAFVHLQRSLFSSSSSRRLRG